MRKREMRMKLPTVFALVCGVSGKGFRKLMEKVHDGFRVFGFEKKSIFEPAILAERDIEGQGVSAYRCKLCHSFINDFGWNEGIKKGDVRWDFDKRLLIILFPPRIAKRLHGCRGDDE